STSFLCFFNHLGGRWPGRSEPEAVQRGAAFVQDPNGHWSARLLDGGGRGHNKNIVVAVGGNSSAKNYGSAQATLASRHSERSEEWSEWDERHGPLGREGSGERVGRRTSSIHQSNRGSL